MMLAMSLFAVYYYIHLFLVIQLGPFTAAENRLTSNCQHDSFDMNSDHINSVTIFFVNVSSAMLIIH